MKPKSRVWKYFKKNNNGATVECLLCGNPYRFSHNTTNLMDHLKRKHPTQAKTNPSSSESDNDEHNGAIQKRSGNVTNKLRTFMERNKNYNVDSARNKKLNLKLAFLVATDSEPFSIVKRQGFQEFVHELDPRYMIPSVNHLKETEFPSLYGILQSKLQSILKDVKYIAITTDTWTSVNMEGFISSTCHFIWKSKLYTAALDTKQIEGSHTAEHLSKILQDIFVKWNVDEKVVCVVTDNGANVVASIKHMKKRHMPCLAHTLNLVSNDCLKMDSLDEITRKCKALVGFFKSSSSGSDKLKKAQVNDGKKPLKLIQSVPTRWNSVFYMFKRILELKTYLAVTLTSLTRAPALPSAEDFLVMEEFLICFECIEAATEEISGEKYVTESLIIPIIRGIHIKLDEIETKKLITTDIGKSIFKELKMSIITRLNNFETRRPAMLATLLDPRIKKHGFRCHENASNANTELLHELKFLTKNEPEKPELVTCDNLEEQPSAEGNSNSLLGFLDTLKSAQSSTSTTSSNCIIEIRQYMETPIIEMAEDPLVYWEKHKLQFPNLYALSEKFLCIPASSVPSERVFSTTGLVLSDKRNRLKSKHVDKLIFVRQNKWLIDMCDEI